MKCPICKSEMEKGFISGAGQTWVKGTPALSKLGEKLGGVYLHVYRCPKCGKVELTTKTVK